MICLVTDLEQSHSAIVVQKNVNCTADKSLGKYEKTKVDDDIMFYFREEGIPNTNTFVRFTAER